jgi:hypothetical protein
MGTVIPAKAGIHSAGHWKYDDDGLDSRPPGFAEDRLRGNDRRIERNPIPNDTTTTKWFANGRNPSPVTLRLMKAPERDTLSPRERAIFPTWAPRCLAKDVGHARPLGGGLPRCALG